MTQFSALSKYFLFACILTSTVLAKPKTVIYWGQESDGKEQPLRSYCASGNYDIIVMGFAYEFPTPSTYESAYPALNFASHCETPHDDANPQLLICPGIAADITYCQSLGVQIIMSFGGGVGRYGFNSDAQAVQFATLVWNMFMEGTGAIRPFGSAIIDGVDLDIEGGSTVGYVAFINKLRSYYATSRRTYVITSAPQCFYPDGRLGPGSGTALGEAWMDYVFVQFYNNYCGLEFMPYLTTPVFNFNVWAAWARTGSANPNVKVFLGAPAALRAVGAGFVNAAKLQEYATSVMSQYPDVYGGIMLWDASNSDNNNNFGAVVSAIVKAQSGTVVESSTPSIPVPATVVETSSPNPIVPPAEEIQPANPSIEEMPAADAETPSPEPIVPSSTGELSSLNPIAPPAEEVQPATPSIDLEVPVAPSADQDDTPMPETPAQIETSSPEPITPSTTGEDLVDTPSPASVPLPPVSVAIPPVSAPIAPVPECSAGSMKCLTSETYSMCNRGSWDASQSCQYGLTCTPSGNYIYCV